MASYKTGRQIFEQLGTETKNTLITAANQLIHVHGLSREDALGVFMYVTKEVKSDTSPN